MAKNDIDIHPFPGLRPFEEEEEYLFFGREKSVTELLSRLRTSRFLAVIGTSGSGKSSLVKAGLLPSLYRGFMAGAGSTWRVALFRPGDDPIGNLAEALTEAGIPGETTAGDQETDRVYDKLIDAALRRSHRGLIDLIKQARLPGHENLLLVIDQFEEIFRFRKLDRSKHNVKRDSSAFIKLLLEGCEQTGIPIYVILTMRSDFLGDCTEFRDLPEAINRSQYLIPRMTREEKRAAVAGPVAVGGAEISPPLLSRLLNDVGDSPDHLPILQHALMRTWDHWLRDHKEGEPLGLEHYEAVGTMERALSKHAEEAYAELDNERSRDICKHMFKLLTDQGETGRGVRRPATVKEICFVVDAPEKEVIQVIDVFRQPGRTFLMPPIGEELTMDSVIDISHESLMRVWTRLIRWVKDESRSVETFVQLARVSRLYDMGRASLYRDPELMLALKWREEQKPNSVWAGRYDSSFNRAIEFLEASKKQQEHEIKEKEKQQRAKVRNARILTAIISIAALVSIAFGISANRSKIEAEKQRQEAMRQEIKARDQQKKAEDNELEARRQKTNADMEKNKAIAAQEEASYNAKIAEENERMAKKAKEESAAAEQVAKESAFEAQIQGLIVEMNREEADSREYLAKAKELAVHSIAQKKDNELKTLLALTSYSLNGKAFHNLITSSVEILKRLNTIGRTTKFYAVGGQKNPASKMVELFKKFRDLLGKTKSTRRPAEIFTALRLAYLAGGDERDVIYRDAESWALAVAGNNRVVFNNRNGELLLAPFHSNKSKLPEINNNGSLPLSGNTVMQAGSFCDTGNLLFCGTRRGNLIAWDKSDWKMKKLASAHNAKILAMTFSKNKNCLYYSTGNMIYKYELNANNAAKPEAVITFAEFNFIRALTVIEDQSGSFLLAADAKGNVYPYDLSINLKEKKTLNPDFQSSGIHAAAYDFGGKLLTLANSRGEIFLFPGIDCNSLRAGKKVPFYRINRKHRGIARSLVFSRNGRYLASGGLDGTVMLWDIKGKSGPDIARQEPVLSFDNEFKILSLVFDDKGENMIFCDERNLCICPTGPEIFYENLCRRKIREFTRAEWQRYLGESIKQEDIIICPQKKGE